MPSTPTDIPSVSPAKPSTTVRAETSVSQQKAVTPVKALSPVKPSVVKQINSYQPNDCGRHCDCLPGSRVPCSKLGQFCACDRYEPIAFLHIWYTLYAHVYTNDESTEMKF